MDVSHTMDSYGPSSVLLAVIALLFRVALSGAEIAKAHRIQALAAIHNLCVYSKEEWWLSVPDIYDLRPFISSGDGQHNKAPKSLHSKERRKAPALRSRNSQDWLTQSGALWKLLECCVQKMWNSKKIITLLPFHLLPYICIHVVHCIHAVHGCNVHKAKVFTAQYPQNWFHSAIQI